MTQQIYIPLGDVYPIPYEFDADTMQVPRGQYSVISELAKGNLTSADAIIYFTMNHGSTWNSGLTWGLSTRYLSDLLGIGMSRRHLRERINFLTDAGWIDVVNKESLTGAQYRLRHHLCDPEDIPVNRDGKPLKFAVPRGEGGVIERCKAGDISWKAALVWIVLKLHSNWKADADTAGQTEQATLLDLSKKCRIKLAGFQKVITELTQAGMLQRLSPKSQKAIFQLYPKPFPKPVQTAPPRRSESVQGKSIETDGEFYYSHNNQYRCRCEDGEIQRIQRGGTWKRVSDYHKYQEMPRAILRDFERYLEVRREIKSANPSWYE